MLINLNNVVLYFFIIFLFYAAYLYLRLGKKEVIEVGLTGVFIIFIGWLNIPNFFPLAEESIKNSINFFPYKMMETFKIGYVLFTSACMIAVIEGIKEIVKSKYSKLIKKEKINEIYDSFIEDATQLYIIGKDLDFLEKNEIQIKKFKSLGEKCKIIITSDRLTTSIKKIYCDLLNDCVDIRKIDFNVDINEFSNLRGQIKIDSSGVVKCLFVEKCSNNKDKYKIIEITNQFLIKSLKTEFEKIHFNGKHPLIKHIAIDLGRVYFDGDFKDFVKKVNEEIGTNVLARPFDTVLLDKELNLGTKNIYQVWESRSNRPLTVSEKEYITDSWKAFWNPNPKMKKIVEIMVGNGYEVYPVGNIDADNGDHYKISNYFSAFNNKPYMSYENHSGESWLLPQKEFYEHFVLQEKCAPYEVLLIDDELDDINGAKESQWNTIHFDPNKTIDKFIDDLINKKIFNNVDKLKLYPKLVKSKIRKKRNTTFVIRKR